MNKKIKLYLLILINILAWGYVGITIYNALQGDDDFVLDYGNTSIKNIVTDKKNDSITLSLNYADPFLKHNTNFKSSGQNKANNSIASEKTPINSKKPEINLSAKKTEEQEKKNLEIKYLGMLKNSDKGTITAMVNVSGKSLLVKNKEKFGEYTIIDISTNSITLKKGKEKMTITK